MTAALPTIYLARHGETAWTVSGQHTGLSDIPLTERGEENARLLGARLHHLSFAQVWTSPLQRARKTAELAGFPAAQVDPDLVEWNYGAYEGLTTAQIRAKQPDWDLFCDGCPGGEAPAQVAARADRVIARFKAVKGDALAFSSGHFSRVLGARWCRLDVSAARSLYLSTAALSALGHEHDWTVIRLWNDTSHLNQESPR